MTIRERKDFGTIRENERGNDNPEKAKTDEQPDPGKQSSNADFRRNKDGIYGGLTENRDPKLKKPSHH